MRVSMWSRFRVTLREIRQPEHGSSFGRGACGMSQIAASTSLSTTLSCLREWGAFWVSRFSSLVQKVWISGLCYRRRNDIEFNLGVGFLGNDVEFNVGVGLGNDIEFNVGVGLGDLLRWGKGSKKRRCTATANVKYVRVSKGKGACVPVPRYWDLGAKHVGATSGKYKGGSVYADHVICVYSSPKKGSTSLTPPDSTPPSTSHPARSKKEKTQPRRVWCMVPQERAVYYMRSYLLVSLWFTDPGAVAITSQLANGPH